MKNVHTKNVRMTTDIDPVDMSKLTRLAGRAGLSVSDAMRVICTRGPDFFLALSVGATK